MVDEIGRDDVERLVTQGAQLVDVLPRQQYEEEHIAGAISMPLKQLDQDAGRLRRDRAVIVYCYDAQ
jgi:rhodanese-related sulfurtransferase